MSEPRRNAKAKCTESIKRKAAGFVLQEKSKQRIKTSVLAERVGRKNSASFYSHLSQTQGRGLQQHRSGLSLPARRGPRLRSRHRHQAANRPGGSMNACTTITLPFPPSVNGTFRKHNGSHLSERYREWRDAAGWELKAQRPQPIKGKVPYRDAAGRSRSPGPRRRQSSESATGPAREARDH